MLNEVPFNIVYSTGEREPIEFFFDALLESRTFDLGLGFFSSSGINVLSAGFAFFIHKGGRMRVIINDVLSEQDKDSIEKGINLPDSYFENGIIDNIKELSKTLSKQDEHFFKCLSYLIAQKRIEFIATVPLNNKGGIAHNKYGIFTDECNNKVVFNGSANFSKNALINNIESISCYKSWSDSENEKERLSYFENVFSKTWQGKSKNIKIIPIENVKSYILNSFPVDDIQQLVNYEKDIAEQSTSMSERISNKLRDLYHEIEKIPRFPFSQGPRQYQKDAYDNWVNNDYHGIFAMATGTGKTITSLNCVLNEYQKNGQYNVLVLVPTLVLVEQWESEIKKFSFNQYILVSGSTNWKEKLSLYKANYRWRKKNENIIIIATYQSFINDKFLKLFCSFQENFTIIADEAHNIGALSIREAFSRLNCKKRIALSATPKRIYDIDGTLELEKFFKDKEPYCYTYSLEKAIDNDFLTSYYYYPMIVHLESDEMEEYIRISKRLLMFFDFDKGTFKSSEEVEKLLLQRKRIIHKAINKLDVFGTIIKKINDSRKLKYCFTFAPEGDYVGDNSFEEYNNIIDRFILKTNEVCPNIRVNSYTSRDSSSDRKDKLRGFADGKIDILFTMKAIDEGVDIPRAEIGIFTSSTGNPRQFIQRRGRLLRKHKDKQCAYIYDLIVIPSGGAIDGKDYFRMEKKLVEQEMKRVGYFASLSKNFYDSKDVLQDILDKYNLSLDTIIKEL